MRNFSELELLKFYTFEENIPGGNILVDVGAHHGSVSMTFAKKGWKVIAFEPEVKNREALKNNLTSFQDIKIFSKAVSEKDQERIPFYTSEKHFGIHSIMPFHDTHTQAYEVETITLNTALQNEKITHVSLLKVDTEGADFLALKGFDINRYNPEIIMLEFMDERSEKNFGYSHHDVVKFMEPYSYVCYISEWEPIKEYGIEGVKSESHVWINIVKYPLDHQPAWGNLIFVRKESNRKFRKTLNRYLKIIGIKKDLFKPVKNRLLRIPLIHSVYLKTIK